MTNLDQKREQVKEVLSMQIEVTTEVNTIFKCNGKIYSSQTYKGSLDQDMSDFAVGYYELLYDRKVLETDDFICHNFAGDTINTGIYELGSNSKIKLENRYCLANFWLIPYQDGRKGQKSSRDYADLYLKNVQNWIEQGDDKFQEFKTFDNFKKKHFIPEQVLSKTLKDQKSFLKNRAELISKSDKVTVLWDYFNNLNLF